MKRFRNAHVWVGLLVVLLMLLAACGGSADEPVEDTSETDTGAVDDATDSETIEGGGSEATGSEKDSGELPPTPDTGSKTDAPRPTPDLVANADTAVATPTPPANRSEPAQTTAARRLDLVLLLDATGSMADELTLLQEGLPDIGSELASQAQANNITLRYGFVIFRDQAKGSPLQLFNLTDNWSLFAENLRTVTAVGGGDYPEDLNGGFYKAVTGMNWHPEADRAIILLGDAPPHLDNTESVPYGETVLLATEQNITIFSIGSDGLNTAGAEIYQQIAAAGNGRFIFLSNNPENAPVNLATVQPISNLATVITEIVLEMLNEEVP